MRYVDENRADSTDAPENGEQQAEYYSYSVDDENQFQPGDTLVDRGVDDALDEGYSPAENWSPGEGFGNTPYEELRGETLEQRIAQEDPERDPYEQAATEPGDSDEVYVEVGRDRTGRLIAEDRGRGPDLEQDIFADDIGIDGAGASAEEAAMHTISED